MKKVLWNKEWTFTSDICDTPVKINLPHDAMQTEKRVPGMVNGPASGCYPGGKYTYVKRLEVSAEDLRKTTLLEFEGIYMKSSVYLNGSLVGGHIYGYTDFYVDLTGKLQAGSNEIKVIADNTQCPNSRWYSGSGIYRDVWLHTAEEAYLKPGGIRVTTLSIAPAKILAKYAKDHENYVLKAGFVDGELLDANGVKELAETPSKEVLIGRLMGSLQSGLYGFAYAIQAIIDKQEGGEAAAE